MGRGGHRERQREGERGTERDREAERGKRGTERDREAERGGEGHRER